MKIRKASGHVTLGAYALGVALGCAWAVGGAREARGAGPVPTSEPAPSAPSSTRPLEGLKVLDITSWWATSRRQAGRAAERDSKDPRVHYYNALLISRAGGLGGGVKSEEMKKELETAIVLDPKLADAYSLLAYAQAFSGEPEKGLTSMKKAVELSPRNEGYQVNLANMYMANRKVDEAIAAWQHAIAANPRFAP